MQTSEPVHLVLNALEAAGIRPRESGGGWASRCPAHEDSTPSLSIRRGDDGRALLKCHGGCPLAAILAVLNLEARSLFPSRNRVMQPRTPRRSQPAQDWTALQEGFREALTSERLQQLADQLGLEPASLQRMDIGWADVDALSRVIGKPARSSAWTFPMRDARLRIIGINARTERAHKWTLSGGHLGLFIPQNFESLSGPTYIVEGASDTAAALEAGFRAVGRPSAKGGAAILTDLLSGEAPDRSIWVLAENDQKSNGTWPGMEGAKYIADKLAAAWKVEALPIARPPKEHKDFRTWWHATKKAQGKRTP